LEEEVEANIKMDLREIGCEYMDWIELALDVICGWAFLNDL
jgi:hypothetical protein